MEHVGMKEIQNKHRELIRRLATTYKKTEIAKALGVSLQTVVNLSKSPMIQREVQKLQDKRDEEFIKIDGELRDLEPECVSVLKDVLTDGTVEKSLKAKVAITVLKDMNGHQAVKKVEHLEKDKYLSENQLDAIKKKALELGLIANSPEVAEVKSIEDVQ